jgi:hypothetical protein
MSAADRFRRGGARQLAAGGAVSFALILGVAILSARPVWQSLPPDTALLRLSFTHSGVRACRARSEEELAALPPNMRSAEICDRRRAPVRVEMDLDGRTILAEDLAPSGLAGSGPSRVYHRLELPAGSHHLDLRLGDDPAAAGFAHSARFEVMLVPAQSLAIDFDPDAGGFFIR